MKQLNQLSETLKKPRFRRFMAFFLPLLCVMITYLALGLSPFGERTVLSAELNGQYVSALAHFREMFSDGFFYSFSKALGGDMMGFSAYYLLSPLNILLLLCPLDRIALGVSFLAMLKVALAGLTFYLFLSRKHGHHAMCLAFSTAYALSGFAAAFQFHPMWLDGAVLLPLIIGGIENIFAKKSPALFLITLFLGIFSCYPIGWALLVFGVLYALYYAVSVYGKPKEKLRSVFIVLLNSAVSAGLSAFVWLPAMLSSEPANGGLTDDLTMETNFPLYGLISKLFSGSGSADMTSGLPQLFVGILTVLLLGLYFCNKNIKLKEKIPGGMLLIFLTMSFYIRPLDVFWNGMTETGEFHFRYGFLFAFMAISLAAECFFRLDKGVNWIKILSVSAVIMGLAAAVLIINFENITIAEIVTDMVLIAAGGALLYFFCFGNKKFQTLCIAGMFLLTLGGSAYSYVNSTQSLPRTEEKLYSHISGLKPLIEEISDKDRSFYRLEKNFHYSANDPMLFSYHGLSYMGIGENKPGEYLEKWGYTAIDDAWSFYGNRGSTLAADGFFGVKYFLTKGAPYENYRKWIENGDVTAYVNPYALPIGFTAKKHILKDFSGARNTFEFQNEIYSAITEDYRQLFTPASECKIKVTNLTGTVEDGYYSYKKLDPEKEAYVDFEFTAMNSDLLYVGFSAKKPYPAELSLNGSKLGTCFTGDYSDIISLKSHWQGKKLHMRLTANEDRLEFAAPEMYYLNQELLQEFTSMIKLDSCELIKKSGSYLAGFVDVVSEGEYMLTTIPYDDNWKITIDGEEAKPISAAGGLLAAELPVGFHALELRYIPDGWVTGAWISAGTFLFIAAVFVFRRRKKLFKSRAKTLKNSEK